MTLFSSRLSPVYLIGALMACFAIGGGSTLLAQARLDPHTADSLAKVSNDPLKAADIYSQAWMHGEAIKVLEAYGKRDAESLWRLARSRVDVGEQSEGSEALPYFEQAQRNAEEAVKSDPTNAKAYEMVALAGGRVALHIGIFRSIGLTKKIYGHAHQALALNPNLATSYSILGRAHLKLMEKPAFVLKMLGLGWAREDSVYYYFDKALLVDNNLIQTRVTYAEFLMDKGDDAKARRLLEEALTLPIRDELDEPSQKRARELLKRLAS